MTLTQISLEIISTNTITTRLSTDLVFLILLRWLVANRSFCSIKYNTAQIVSSPSNQSTIYNVPYKLNSVSHEIYSVCTQKTIFTSTADPTKLCDKLSICPHWWAL